MILLNQAYNFIPTSEQDPTAHPESWTATSHGCPVCDGVLFQRLYEKNDYPLMECQKCHLVCTGYYGPKIEAAPNPTNENPISKLYENRYPLEVFQQERPRKIKKSAEELDLLAKLRGAKAAPGKLLDVGCSYGFFLEVARERGWQVEGVEPSPVASRYARKDSGLEVFNGSLEAARFPAQSFDVVTIRHVLEHIPDAGATLDEAWRILKPGGLLLVAVPNLESLNYRLNGQHWWWIDPPTHWWYFNRRTLIRLLFRHHFHARHVSTHRADDQTLFQASLYSLNLRLKLAPGLRHIAGWFRPNQKTKQSFPTTYNLYEADPDAAPDNRLNEMLGFAPSEGQLVDPDLINRQWGKVNRLGEALHQYFRPIGRLAEQAGLGSEILIVAEKRDAPR